MSLPRGISFAHIKDVVKSAVNGKSLNPTLLGRWNTNPSKNVGLVADYSNEDHCGPCGEYVITKEKEKQRNTYKPPLKYEDATKVFRMRRRNFHTDCMTPFIVDTNLLNSVPNQFDTLSSDYMASILPQTVDGPVVSPDGPDEDPDDDDPNGAGATAMIVMAGVYTGIRATQRD